MALTVMTRSRPALAREATARDPIAHGVSGISGDIGREVTLDRATPRRTLQSFLDASRAGDFAAAAQCLDLHGTPDPTTGPALAAELSYVLYRRVPIDLAQVTDDPVAHDRPVVVDTFEVGDQEVPLSLAREKFEDGIDRWVVSRATVARIPDIAATIRSSAWRRKLPRALLGPVIFGNAPWQWLGVLVSLLVAYAVGRISAAVATRIGTTFAKRTTSIVDDLVVAASRRPLRWTFASVAFSAFLFPLQLSLAVNKVLDHLTYSAFILGNAWLLLAAFNLAARIISPAHALTGELQADAAGDRTRRALLQRVASAGVVGITVALLLLQFDVVRHVGLSLLASAGIAGVVLGLAAQKSLAGLIAGIQLSITQPVRLGDVILIEGENGVVQDIFLTYAVVRFWDSRCVIVPISRFLEQPFQNWTLLRQELTAVVLLHVKFSAPVELLRQQVRILCDANPSWDKRRADLEVGDSDMNGMVLRVVVSAKTPNEAWDLKCAVREGLIVFMQALDDGKHLG